MKLNNSNILSNNLVVLFGTMIENHKPYLADFNSNKFSVVYILWWWEWRVLVWEWRAYKKKNCIVWNKNVSKFILNKFYVYMLDGWDSLYSYKTQNKHNKNKNKKKNQCPYLSFLYTISNKIQIWQNLCIWRQFIVAVRKQLNFLNISVSLAKYHFKKLPFSNFNLNNNFIWKYTSS